MNGALLVSPPPPDQSRGPRRQGHEVLGEDGCSHFKDLLKGFPRSRVVLEGLQKSSATLLQKTLQWLPALQNVPHKHACVPLGLPLYFHAFLCGSERISVPQSSHSVPLCTPLSHPLSKLLFNFEDSIPVSLPWRDIPAFLHPVGHHDLRFTLL